MVGTLNKTMMMIGTPRDMREVDTGRLQNNAQIRQLRVIDNLLTISDPRIKS